MERAIRPTPDKSVDRAEAEQRRAARAATIVARRAETLRGSGRGLMPRVERDRPRGRGRHDLKTAFPPACSSCRLSVPTTPRLYAPEFPHVTDKTLSRYLAIRQMVQEFFGLKNPGQPPLVEKRLVDFPRELDERRDDPPVDFLGPRHVEVSALRLQSDPLGEG